MFLRMFDIHFIDTHTLCRQTFKALFKLDINRK